MNYKLTFPSEWHEQLAVQLTWPHENTDWAPYLSDIVTMEIAMANEITKREHLIVATPDPDGVRSLLAKHLSEEQMLKVSFFEMPTNDTWARDHAAVTLLPVADEGNASSSSVRLLNFRFNGWGDKFRADFDNKITENLEAKGAFSALYTGGYEVEDHDDFVLEGGAIESDGMGTVFTTSFCLLAPHRNQPLTQEQIEEELKRRLHCKRVVWIDHGQLIGDDTDGHIDTIVRPAPDNTLLYVQCTDANDEQYADFCAMEEQLKTFRTLDGKPYRLLPLPMPEAMYDDGDRLPATYANFLITNKAVLVPTYNQPENDEKALAQIAKAFPGRDVVGIDACVAVRQHGSLHCLTMQFPSQKE